MAGIELQPRHVMLTHTAQLEKQPAAAHVLIGQRSASPVWHLSMHASKICVQLDPVMHMWAMIISRDQGGCSFWKQALQLLSTDCKCLAVT